jgi:uncharacterized protein (DUF302 family)
LSYHFSKTVKMEFGDAVRAAVAALAGEGFGVLSEIDVAAALKKKLGVDFRPYRILGACHPASAYEALKLEDKIGAMLPCNVVVQEHAAGDVEISAVDPVASMQAIDNKSLAGVAQDVRERLKRVIDNI